MANVLDTPTVINGSEKQISRSPENIFGGLIQAYFINALQNEINNMWLHFKKCICICLQEIIVC